MPAFSRALRYFAEVAREGSVRKAAAKLHVAASAVNYQIIELEKSLGVSLFDRRPSGLKLSAAGELLICRVRVWQMEFEQTRAVLDDLLRLKRGKIRIAAISGLASDFLPRVMASFQRNYPNVSYEIDIGSADETIDKLENGNAEICLTFDAPPRRPFKRVASLLSHMGVAVSPTHALAGLKQIRLYDLIATPVAIPSRGVMLREFIENSQDSGAFKLETAVETNSIEVMKSFARMMGGAALLTNFDVAREVRSGELVHIPFAGKVAATQVLVALIRDGIPQSIAASAFIEQLQSAFDAAASEKSP